MNTDPYGDLEFVIGTEDDFWCFDYCLSDDKNLIRLHATINSETGSFIMDAEKPVELPLSEAVGYAQSLVDQAMCWLVDGGEPILDHDTEGWNQDSQYFVRCVKNAVDGGAAGTVPRIVEE